MREVPVNDRRGFRGRAAVGLELREVGGDAVWRGASATGLARDRQRDAFVHRGGEQRGLAVARVADDGDALRVDLGHRLQVVHHAGESPRPRHDRRGVRRSSRFGARRSELFQQLLGERLFIRDHVAIEEGRDGISTVDGLLDGPRILLLAAPGFTRAILRSARILLTHPAFRHLNLRIVEQRVIAREVQAEEAGDGARALVRDDDEQMHRLAEPAMHEHLAQRRLAAERRLVFAQQLAPHRACGWQRAIHVVLEERAEFRCAFALPVFFRRDASAVAHRERIRQCGARGQRVGRGEFGGERGHGGEEEREERRGLTFFGCHST